MKMDWPFPPPDEKRIEELLRKSPDDAIAIWLNGSFTIGEEPALFEAIREGLLLRLDDDEMTGIVCDCMDSGASVAHCKELLFKASHLKQ